MPESVIALKNIYSKNRTVFLLVLKILVAAGILLLIVFKINISGIISVYQGSNKYLILFALILSAFNIYIQYLKWKLVCNSLLDLHNKKKIFYSLFYGFSAGSFTPARIGEYFGRAFLFTDKPLMQVTAAVVIDKFFTLLVVSVIGSVFFLFYLNSSLGIFGLIILLLLSMYFIVKAGSKPVGENLFLRWIRKYKRLSSLYSYLSFIKNIDYKFRVRLVILSLLFYACFIIQFALLVIAFTNHFNIFGYIWAGMLVMFTKTIIPSVSFGELGIREGVSVYFIKKIGETAAAGFNASIFLFLINIILPALFGFILMLKRKW